MTATEWCGRCGVPLGKIGRTRDDVPYCIDCSACSHPGCAAWAVTPGGNCTAHTEAQS